ncbi:MAG: hypothetical protein ABJA86_13650 [Nocardioidaceae bacterium]
MHPIIAIAVAEEHRRDLYRQAEHARLVRAARSGSKPPLAAGQRRAVRRTRFRPVRAFHSWFVAAGRSWDSSVPIG